MLLVCPLVFRFAIPSKGSQLGFTPITSLWVRIIPTVTLKLFRLGLLTLAVFDSARDHQFYEKNTKNVKKNLSFFSERAQVQLYR